MEIFLVQPHRSRPWILSSSRAVRCLAVSICVLGAPGLCRQPRLLDARTPIAAEQN